MFYHLMRSDAETVLDMLLPRALAAGWPVMVRGTDDSALDRLDSRLWLQPEDSFLPHGREGGVEDARQPVLIGRGAAVNAARAVALIDGAEPLPGEEAMERLWVLFDGHDPAALAAARGLWTRLTAAGMAAQYWSEESGRWQMKAEKKPVQA